MSYSNMIGQANNASSILGFSLAGKRTVHVLIFLFIHWLIKQITNTYRNYYSRSYENRSNSSTSRGDQSLISPWSDTAQTIIKVVRIKEMINKCKSSGKFNRFSSLVPWEVYGEKCGEYPWWYQNGWRWVSSEELWRSRRVLISLGG